jgi:hypothetical protein
VRVEDRLQALSLRAAGDALQAALEARGAADEQEDQHEQDDAGDPERDDDGADRRVHERVEIVHEVLRAGAARVYQPGRTRHSLAG